MNRLLVIVSSSAVRSAVSTAFLSLAVAIVAPGASQAEEDCGPTVTVEAGDTLSSIARRCNTSVDALQEINPDVDPRSMAIGQRLRITDSPEATGTVNIPTEYRVRPGDSPAGIATAFGVTLEALLEANPGLESEIEAGTEIVLPPGAEAPEDWDDGRRDISGVITDEGVECQAMRDQNGQLYMLIGNLEGYRSGDQVEVRGTVPEVSHCGQGVTIDVEEIRQLG